MNNGSKCAGPAPTRTVTCQIPGCTELLASPGVCDDCRAAFGDMLRGDIPLTEQQVARRDHDMLEVLLAQRPIQAANQ